MRNSLPTIDPNTMLSHAAMLGDRARTSTYIEAIRKVVRPGDVVVDIGTGSGVLAVAAAQAGARRVYAIEARPFGRVARAVFEANGVADRVTLVKGWSTRVELPERADVLVSELIGNEPLCEDVVEVTTDARARHLKPGARLLPARMKVFGLPVEIPDPDFRKRTFCPDMLRNLKAQHGIDFGPLGEVARHSPLCDYVNTWDARGWKALADPVLLADVDFRACKDLSVDINKTLTARASGRLSGLLVYFEAMLAPGVTLSTRPGVARQDNSWLSPLFIFVEPLTLRAGERFEVNYWRLLAKDEMGCEVRRGGRRVADLPRSESTAAALAAR